MGEKMSNHMYCKKCGKPLTENARFCTFCGYKLTDDDFTEDKTVEEAGDVVDYTTEREKSAETKFTESAAESNRNIFEAKTDTVFGKAGQGIQKFADTILKHKIKIIVIVIIVVAAIVSILVIKNSHQKQTEEAETTQALLDDFQDTAIEYKSEEELEAEKEAEAEAQANERAEELKQEYQSLTDEAESLYLNESYLSAFKKYSDALDSQYEEYYMADDLLMTVCRRFIDYFKIIDFDTDFTDDTVNCINTVCAAIELAESDGYELSSSMEEFYYMYNNADWYMIAISHELDNTNTSWTEDISYDEQGRVVTSPINPYNQIAVNYYYPNFGEYTLDDPFYICYEDYLTYYRYDQEEGLYDFSYDSSFETSYARVLEATSSYENLHGLEYPTYIYVYQELEDGYSESYYYIQFKDNSVYINPESQTIHYSDGHEQAMSYQDLVDAMSDVNDTNSLWSCYSGQNIFMPSTFNGAYNFYMFSLMPNQEKSYGRLPCYGSLNWYYSSSGGKKRISQTTFAYVYCNPDLLKSMKYDKVKNSSGLVYIMYDMIGDDSYDEDYKDSQYANSIKE